MKWLRTRLFVLTFICASFATLNAHAGTVVCSGTVETIAYHSNNQFMVRLSSMNTPVYFCSSESTWNVVAGFSTGTQTCKMFFAMFLAAKESGRTVNSVYFDSDDAPATCNTWATWKYANIRFFEY